MKTNQVQTQVPTRETLIERARQLITEKGVTRFNRATPGDATLGNLGELPYTGYPDGRIYGWDSYFEAILHKHLDLPVEYGRNALTLFLRHQERGGFIPRTLPHVWWGNFHQQPFLAQLALTIHRRDAAVGELSQEEFYQLKAYLCYWKRQCIRRDVGLSAWDHAGQTGMDNHFERAGYFHDFFCEGVDLNCYLVCEWRAMAELAEIHGLHAEVGRCEDEIETLSAAIQTWLWCPEEGTFLDYHAEKEISIPVRYAGMFLPLWAEVATPEQAEILVERHLKNPEEFATPFPIPALSRSDPGYMEGWHPKEFLSCCSWRAHVWLPVNYMIVEGLKRYGYDDLAESIATRTSEMFARNPFREYYLAETGEPMGRDPFTGWSSLALFMSKKKA